MIKKPIFIFGMIRSGTTFLSKALSAHSNILIASDPYLQFFKAFRNEIGLISNFNNFDCDSPISDEFFLKNNNLQNIIKRTDFDVPITHFSLSNTLKLISKFTERDSFKIKENLKHINKNVNNYGLLLDQLLDIIKISYGDKNTINYGFKSTFSEQFISAVINRYNDAKCIFILRDPRSIYASHINEHEKQYPLLFVLRNWRKSIYYYLENKNKKNNIYFVKYEDLISNIEGSLEKICRFIDVKFDKKMIDSNNYMDGKNNKWKINSSFAKSNIINNNSWEKILSPNYITIIEKLTKIEMNYFNYEISNKDQNIKLKNLINLESKENIYDWIKPYYDDYKFSKNQLENEQARLDYIDNPSRDIEYEQKLLLSKSLFE